MIEKIKDIVTIQTGIYTKPELKGDVIYLLANHFDEYGRLQEGVKPNLSLNKKIKKHLLEPGDVLYAAKGARNMAICVTGKMEQGIASSVFLVLKVKNEFRRKIIPEFLTWFLNHPNTKVQLKSKAIGTDMLSISKKVLGDFEVVVPDLHIQQSIVIIDELRKKERILKKEIETLREKQLQQLFHNLTTGKIRINEN